jgi:hypothetical protein
VAAGTYPAQVAKTDATSRAVTLAVVLNPAP